MSQEPIRLLFTNEDLGHSFDDDYQALALIARVAKKEWVLHKDFDTGAIGGSCREQTGQSEIPSLYQKWRYVYLLDSRTYSTLYHVLDAFLNTEAP
ncbi:hypothetical protein [Hymenobacter sp. BT491]|uniref:hypothetical protein n=1 Tax=Hymenobacter sp. BT491 TaxID=2766779 RepID=UPI001653A739|nr:hypothetical protein [Hymenobacter sp. BT491]MBC6988963.1 hypothetical protein [Hymenobacter sp. BT491]